MLQEHKLTTYVAMFNEAIENYEFFMEDTFFSFQEKQCILFR